MKYILLLIISGYCSPQILNAQLRLPSLISSSMVLQQKDSVNVWGWAYPGEKVFVVSGWNNQVYSTLTTGDAQWKVKIGTPAAGGPYDILIVSRDTIKLKDVMIGEVWVCSGQSNMEWCYNYYKNEVAEEFPTIHNTNIRLFHIPKTTSLYPQDNVMAQWEVCDSNTIKRFSSVGYFFGKKLNAVLGVPIGLINASWGGTPAEVWTPNELVQQDEILKSAADSLKSYDWWPDEPGRAFNGMIAPLTQYNIAGTIWYQGESNVSTNATYKKLFTTMIDGWRAWWKKEFPFYYVQIAPFDYGDNENGALLQESQTLAMSHPNVGMVVISDLIDSVTNIHPSRKREVGNRLANWALAETYHKNGIVYKSPKFRSAELKSGKLMISFDNVPVGLQSKDKTLKDFFISDDGIQWHAAQAKIEKDKIIAWNKKVKQPKYVRYAFGNTLTGNVSSVEGLPIIPFRTDPQTK